MAVRFSRFDRWGKLIGTLEGVYRAEHTDELNGEDIVELSLTGEIRKGDRIVWADSLGAWHEHIVREVSEISDGDGRRREAVCENSIAELYGDFVDDIRPTDKTCASALSQVLSEGGTRWSVGTVTVEGLASCTMYRESAREALADILKTWGGELSTTIDVSGCEVTARKVNITRRGSDRGRRFEYGKGMSEIARVYSADDVYTALYGFGKGEETGGGYGRRIDFSSQGAYGPTDGGTVHVSGKMYVENPAALEEWGRPGASGKAHVFGSVSFTDCEDPAELMRLTAMQLDYLCQPKVSYEASVAEFAKWGYDFSDSFTGDTVAVIDSAEGFDIRVRARVTKTVRDLLDECALTQLTVGNIVTDVSGMIADQYAEVKEVTRRSSAWDVAAFTTNSYMEQLVGRFNTRFEEGGVYKYESFEQGTVYSSVPLDEDMRPVSTPAMAFQLKGGGFRISDTVGPDGHFVWSTMADGAGIVAESIVTGILSDAEGKNFWNLDTGEFRLSSYAPSSEATGNVVVEYALGDSQTVAPESGWSADSPVWTEGKYIWQRTKTTTVDGIERYSSPACIQGAKGEQGLPGAPGAPGKDGEDGTSVRIMGSYASIEELQAAHPTGEQGDAYIVGGDLCVWTGSEWKNVGAIQGPAGMSSYVHFAYATSADGSQGFSTTAFAGAVYVGVRTDNTLADSTNYRDYAWSRILGEQGKPGVSVTGVTNYYLATNSSSGVTTSTSGWTTTVQSVSASKKYLWNYEVVRFSDNTTAPTAPCIIGAYGDKGETGSPGSNGSNGRGISSITEYYLTTSASSGVTTSTSGWAKTPSATSTSAPYLWNYERIDYTDGTFTNTTPAIIGTHGAKGDPGSPGSKGDPGSPGEKGDTGTGVSEVVAQYYLSTSSTSQSGGSWSTSQPAWVKGKYIWTRSAVTWTDGTTTYTSPVLAQAINGANQSASDAKDAVTSLDQSLNSEGVFNRLTNNGSMQGIFLEGGQLYMNADYIKTGTLVAKKLVDPENSANYGIVGTAGGYTGLNFYPGGKLAYNIASSMFSTGKPALFAIRVPYTANDGTEQSAFAVSINSSSITMSNVAYSNNAKKAGSTGTYLQLQATVNGVIYYNEDKDASYKVFAVPGQCDSYPLLYGFTLYRNGGTVTLANTGAQSHTIAGNWGGKSLGTIPVGYRPPATLHFQPVAISGKDIYLEVKSDGTCQLVNGESSSYTGIVPVSGTWAMAN